MMIVMDEAHGPPGEWSDVVWHLSNLDELGRRQPAGAADRQAAGSPAIEERLERLALLCMAMWTLVQSETGLTEDQLLERVREIDLMDGVPDGAITRQVTTCSKCRRPMSSRHTRCIYCGHENRPASAFDTV
jgi:hypothetical protein